MARPSTSSSLSWTFLSLLLSSTVYAHGRIAHITADGKTYTGFDPALAFNKTPSELPPLAAWTASNLGNVFVSPADFNTQQITCHFNATPGQSYINIQAGHSINMQWNEWPTSHKGPVMTYLAPCNGSCTNIDKTKLEFVKIDELGWINASDPIREGLGGTWASDLLIANNFTWSTTLPANLEEGNYVLRHEIIALHVANETDGAQAYPQCLNLKVGKNVTAPVEDKPSGGSVAPRFYKMTDPGILVDIHGHNVTGYDIPGPKLWNDAVPNNHSSGHGHGQQQQHV